jgi:hypothetical protein
VATLGSFNCGGTFCDRQDPRSERYVCYSTNRKKQFLFTFEIQAMVPESSISLEGNMASWKFCHLAFREGEEELESQDHGTLTRHTFTTIRATLCIDWQLLLMNLMKSGL